MAEQRHEIVCHDYKVSTCLCSPKVVGDKVIAGEVILQFLDPVLRIRSSAIRIVYYLDRKDEFGDKTAVTVFADSFPFSKSSNCLTCLPAASGRFYIFCQTIIMHLGLSWLFAWYAILDISISPPTLSILFYE